MKRRHRIPKIRKRDVKEIKYESDYQSDWHKYVPELKSYDLQSVDFLTISGDAPKDFVSDQEYRPGHRSRRKPKDRFVGKVGSKYYPLESIIEQFITRIGQTFGLNIADSKLRMIDGQIRFLSKYFIRPGEQLTHGAEIYEYSIGKENYAGLSEQKVEAEYFTFQMTCEAISELFPDDDRKIIGGYVEMLTFDAIIGHNDRHPYNWGVIVPLRKNRKIRFAPVFDTARALFWNIPEKRIVTMLANQDSFESYIRNCSPPIGWDRKGTVAFFDLVALIWKEFACYREPIEKFLDKGKLTEVNDVLIDEFGNLLSKDRRVMILRCLHLRQDKLQAAIFVRESLKLLI